MDLPYPDVHFNTYRDAWTNVDAACTFTSWGAVSSLTIPTEQGVSGSQFVANPVTCSTGYDSLGRPIAMTDNDPNSVNGWSTTRVQNVVYDALGRRTSADFRAGPSVRRGTIRSGGRGPGTLPRASAVIKQTTETAYNVTMMAAKEEPRDVFPLAGC
jgi:hypothetical protein